MNLPHASRYSCGIEVWRKLEIAREGAANTAGATPSLCFRSWTLDAEARTFTAAGAPVDLTRTEFNIVEMLMRHPKRVFSKQELFEGAWGRGLCSRR